MLIVAIVLNIAGKEYCRIAPTVYGYAELGEHARVRIQLLHKSSSHLKIKMLIDDLMYYREMVNVIEHNVKEAADFSGQGLKMLETAEHTVVVRRKVSI